MYVNCTLVIKRIIIKVYNCTLRRVGMVPMKGGRMSPWFTVNREDKYLSRAEVYKSQECVWLSVSVRWATRGEESALGGIFIVDYNQMHCCRHKQRFSKQIRQTNIMWVQIGFFLTLFRWKFSSRDPNSGPFFCSTYNLSLYKGEFSSETEINCYRDFIANFNVFFFIWTPWL